MKTILNKRTNVVIPFGETGAITNKVYGNMFRTFSVYNNSGTCQVTIMENGNVMTIPVGVTVNFDAATEGNDTINKFPAKVFKVNATDCVIVGTL
tara:strand:+ start:213 stop:497 length:285 start_codon:yes stop_codon:yes gene_type:complete